MAQLLTAAYCDLGKANSVIIYYHGGGWVIGNIDDYDAIGRHIAERCNAVVVLVNYRKAPEHKFPIPVNDCYAALNWVSDNMKKIAGGNLPIMVVVTARAVIFLR